MAALGLLLLVAAAVIALAGIFSNTGSSHQLGRSVDILGYHLNGSTGKLLLVGVVLGAVGMLGLMLLLGGLRRGAKKSVSSRRDRHAAQQETAAVIDERDRLAERVEQERAARLRAEKSNVSAVEDRSDVGAEDYQDANSDRKGGLLHRHGRDGNADVEA